MPGQRCTGLNVLARLAADAVAVAVKIVDVGTDHCYRPAYIGRTIPATVRAVDVAGDGHAHATVVRITRSFLGGGVLCAF